MMLMKRRKGKNEKKKARMKKMKKKMKKMKRGPLRSTQRN